MNDSNVSKEINTKTNYKNKKNRKFNCLQICSNIK